MEIRFENVTAEGVRWRKIIQNFLGTAKINEIEIEAVKTFTNESNRINVSEIH